MTKQKQNGCEKMKNDVIVPKKRPEMQIYIQSLKTTLKMSINRGHDYKHAQIKPYTQ